MKTKLLLLCLIVMFITSCKPNPDGTYIVYSTSEPDPSLSHLALPSDRNDFTISREVSQRMKGRKLNLTFTNKFVTIKALDGGKEILLDRTNQYYMEKQSDTVYHTGTTLDGRMTDMNLIVHLNEKEPKAMLRLIAYNSPTDSVGTHGVVFCQMVKVRK